MAWFLACAGTVWFAIEIVTSGWRPIWAVFVVYSTAFICASASQIVTPGKPAFWYFFFSLIILGLVTFVF